MTSAAGREGEGPDLDKPLYTIGIAADILATTTRTLMMYEHFGLVVPSRAGNNRRLFSQRDLLAISAIERLMRGRGLNLAGARYVAECLHLLDAHGIPRPAGLADVDVNHVKVRDSER
ncbi:MAG TPA: MerR family transcriptional regulator [Candidatus Acidoferrales bacterium]|nr:MerR family transcriptional regulator [Candidatus Acidoferrales bacterium]